MDRADCSVIVHNNPNHLELPFIGIPFSTSTSLLVGVHIINSIYFLVLESVLDIRFWITFQISYFFFGKVCGWLFPDHRCLYSFSEFLVNLEILEILSFLSYFSLVIRYDYFGPQPGVLAEALPGPAQPAPGSAPNDLQEPEVTRENFAEVWIWAETNTA